MRDDEVLFSKFRLHDALEGQKQRISEAIRKLPERELTGDAETLISRLIGEHSLKPLELHLDRVNVSREETTIDVSRDQRRMIFDRSHPFYMPGTVIHYYVPFSGDDDLFYSQPDRFEQSPPMGLVMKSELLLRYAVQGNEDVADTKRLFDASIARIQVYIARANSMLEPFNNSILPSLVRSAISERKDRLHQTQQGLEGLGLPIRPW